MSDLTPLSEDALRDVIASAEFLLARAQTHATDPRDMFGAPLDDAEMLRRLRVGVELRERELAEAKERLLAFLAKRD